jgi:hypothetical protein
MKIINNSRLHIYSLFTKTYIFIENYLKNIVAKFAFIKQSLTLIWLLRCHYNTMEWIPHKYRIIAILRVETDIIANISARDKVCRGLLNWHYCFIGDVILCFSDPDFISGTHQSENVKFADKQIDWYIDSCLTSSDNTAIFRMRISSSISITDTEMR